MRLPMPIVYKVDFNCNSKLVVYTVKDHTQKGLIETPKKCNELVGRLDGKIGLVIERSKVTWMRCP